VAEARPDWVPLGRVAGVFGVRGWLKVFSHTDPRAGILDYEHWWLGDGEACRRFRVIGGRQQGRGIVAALEGVTDRDQAAALMGQPIAVPREALPDTDGYYWADLVGLSVVNREGVGFGRITGHIPTGGHDVMVVSGGGRQRLIPWAPGIYVDAVLMDTGRVVVDWHPED